jgi:membrane fusion protein, heavy metal efflux system
MILLMMQKMLLTFFTLRLMAHGHPGQAQPSMLKNTVIFLSFWLALTPVWAHGGHGDEFKGAEKGATEGTIQVAPDVQKGIGLKVAPVQTRVLSQGLIATGRIEAVPSLSVEVNAPLAGRLLQVKAQQGQTVQRGQILAILDSPEIRQLAVEIAQQKTQIQADLFRLKAQVTLAKTTYAREKELYQAKISAQKDLQQAEAILLGAQADLGAAQSRLRLVNAPLQARLSQLGTLGKDNLIRLKAPQSGYIASQTVANGEAVQAGRVLFNIVNTRQVWATADVYEQDLAQVRRGQNVEVRVNANPAKIFLGKVSVIDALVNTDTRTIKVRAVLDNRQNLLKPGMFASLKLVKGMSSPVLVIPQSAVLEVEGKQLVYVKNGDAFIPTTVQLGEKVGEVIAVTDGLFEGDEVVTERAFQLRAQGLRGTPETSKEVETETVTTHSELPWWSWLAGGLALAGAFMGGIVVARQTPDIKARPLSKKGN